MYESFKNMPTILKFITAHALVCSIFLLPAVVPGMPFTVDDKVISFSELWSSGIAPYLVVTSTAMPVSGYLLLKKAVYSREVYLVAVSLGLIVPYIYWEEYKSLWFGVLITVGIALYLFGRANVKYYFASNKSLKERDALKRAP
jgi:hypothetical protein